MKSFKRAEHFVGEPVVVDFIANGNFYMLNSEGNCCNSKALLNIDFELLDIPGNDVGIGMGQPGWHLNKTFRKLREAFWKRNNGTN